MMLLSYCTKQSKKSSTDPPTIPKITELKTINFEIAYEPGAEPFIEATGGGELFSILENHAMALYGSLEDIKIIMPRSLNEMISISDQGKSAYTQEDIELIVKEYREKSALSADGETLNIFIVFLNGFCERDGKAMKDSGGLSIREIMAAAVFKPAIIKMQSEAGDLVLEFVEQSILIHELGHLAGLVNNGVAAASDHEDKEHAKHCNNPDCVMRWQNEGLKDLMSFLDRVDKGDEPIMYCSQCLEDMKAHLKTEKRSSEK